MALVEQNIPSKVAPADPRKPGNDPFRTWAELHHQLGVVVPKKVLNVRQIRTRLVPAVGV